MMRRAVSTGADAVRALSVAASLLFAASATAFAAAEPIRIGEVEPMTGKEAAFGQASHRGVMMAIEEINARGGILGRPLVVITDDNQSKPGDSATITKKLIGRDKVVAVLNGGSTAQCLETAPICQTAKIPMMATTATAAKVTEFGPYIFRNCFIDPFQGAVLAKFARTSLKAQRAAMLSSVSSPFSVGLADVFRTTFPKQGGTIVLEQKYNDGEKDFRAQLTAIRSTNPEVLVVMGFYTEGGLIIRQARELGINCPMLSADGWEAPELLDTAGRAANGVYYSSHYSAESTVPEVQGFLTKYKAKYGGEAPESCAPLAYDGMMILADAIARAGKTDAAAIRDALAATKSYPGVTGRTTIDAQRNASKPAVIVRVEDGKVKFIEAVAP
jgi:branched-chain amino acid transport system substrate-binding protein